MDLGREILFGRCLGVVWSLEFLLCGCRIGHKFVMRSNDGSWTHLGPIFVSNGLKVDGSEMWMHLGPIFVGKVMDIYRSAN